MPRLHALSLAATLLAANACAPAATEPAAPPQPTAVAVAASPTPNPPAQIVAGAIPGDAQFYAEITGIQGLLLAARGVVGEAKLAEARAAMAKEMRVSEPLLEGFLEAIESIHVGGKRVDADVKGAVTVVFRDAKPVRDLVASGVVKESGPFGPHGRTLGSGASDKDKMFWFEGPKLLVVGDEPMAAAIAAVVEGRAQGLSEAQRGVSAPQPGERRVVNAFIAPALLDEFTAGKVSIPAPIAATLGLWEGGMRGSYRASIAAQNLQGNVPLPPPRALAIARRLPAETASYLALSTGLPGGNAGATTLLSQLVTLFGRDADRAIQNLDGALATAGLRLADVLGSLGEEGVVGVSVRPGVKTTAEVEKGYAVITVLELRDPKPTRDLLKTARDLLAAQKKKKHKVRPDGSGFSVDFADPQAPFARAKITGDRLFIGVGQKDLVERALVAIEKGKGTLGDDAAHARALTALPANAGLRLWVDAGRAMELSGADATPGQRAVLDVWQKLGTGPKRITSGLTFTAIPEDDRVRLELDEVNAVGVFAALAIFGTRSYLSSAKQAEAKNALGALSRASEAAFEREHVGPNNTALHRLCKSAAPVPSAVPRGKKYAPSTDPGRDYHVGDQESGWRCLKFEMTEPQYYQYTYIAGGPYKGPKRGGPDPGPNGFEVAAEGDLDGNGVTSLFTRTGVVDAKTGMVRMSSEIWSDKPNE